MMPGKSFPTLSSMPRMPRMPRADEPEESPPRTRRRDATTARPLTREEQARQPLSSAYAPRNARALELTEEETTRFWSADGGWEDASEPAALPAPLPRRAALPEARRTRVNTRMLIKHARSPWSLARLGLAAIAMLVALGYGMAQAGEPSQQLMAYQATSSSKAYTFTNVAKAMKPLTSLLRPDQYDSPAQYQTYSGAACSPSALASVFTAWGVPDATIGHEIDDLGPYLSGYAGLLDQQGFVVAAAKRNFRADIYWHLDYNQILYLTNVVGIPVIINVRRDWGYYHYLDGGHFLEATGGDQQGMTMVDSSEYFIKYLPRDVFLSLWQWRGDGSAQAIVIVPQDFQYTIPNV
jgi:hypothetical protein